MPSLMRLGMSCNRATSTSLFESLSVDGVDGISNGYVKPAPKVEATAAVVAVFVTDAVVVVDTEAAFMDDDEYDEAYVLDDDDAVVCGIVADSSLSDSTSLRVF